MNYCYVCNNPMLQTWVCHDCLERPGMAGSRARNVLSICIGVCDYDTGSFTNELPQRLDRNDPVPVEILVLLERADEFIDIDL